MLSDEICKGDLISDGNDYGQIALVLNDTIMVNWHSINPPGTPPMQYTRAGFDYVTMDYEIVINDVYQYSWGSAPKNAMFAAADSDGTGHWYDTKPQRDDDSCQWLAGRGDDGKLGNCFAILGTWFSPVDWETSLRERPKEDSDDVYQYPWGSAPEWAKFAAADRSGCSYWYADEPYRSGDSLQWLLSREGDYRQMDIFFPGETWKESLRKRPLGE
jgi:hypothetical protein